MEFTDLKKIDYRTSTFTLSPIHVTYANTLRRLILTGVETIAFRSDMTSTGSTTNVLVKQNDTPMTNEMLADRIGLIPIHITEPNTWNSEQYIFHLNVSGKADHTTYVTASDFVVKKIIPLMEEKDSNSDENNGGDEKNEIVSTEEFFPKHHLTGQTCLIATLQPGSGSNQQHIEITAKASKGTGREHARFCPVSQCSYEYTQDNNPQRIEEMFQKWLINAKKISNIDKASERYQELQREFNTMQIKRCYKVDDKNEPYSFDFTIESLGILTVEYIVERACEVGQNMCSRYINMDTGNVPPEVTITSANCKLIGFDFLVRGHDHTLGNLLQTWLVQNLIEGDGEPKITYAGYSVPHPLRDEMILRIGVENGEEKTAREAFAAAARGCVEIFQQLRTAWRSAIGAAPLTLTNTSRMVRRPGSKPVPRSLPKSTSKVTAKSAAAASSSSSTEDTKLTPPSSKPTGVRQRPAIKPAPTAAAKPASSS